MSQFDPNQPFDPNTSRPRDIFSEQEIKPRRNPLRRLLGCILLPVIAIIIVGSIAFGIYGIMTAFGVDLGPISSLVNSIAGGPEMRPVSGDASRFDPIAALPDVQDFAGTDAKLASIRANYVRSDGTMDLTATYVPGPSTEYVFLREVPPPANAPPVGAAGSNGGPWYEPIEINAFKPGAQRTQSRSANGVRTRITYINRGLTRSVEAPTTSVFDLPTTNPTCSFADLWKIALTKDAPSDAVAVIDYSADGYDFSISSVITLYFDQDCKLRD
ncbi:MAG TPA: hypothetical protein VHL11_08610 [Phototrophicaceae bacterium]|jgi:hypothetical protein|nr:hypothetical protein [Phototrophicaceae bacterium]